MFVALAALYDDPDLGESPGVPFGAIAVVLLALTAVVVAVAWLVLLAEAVRTPELHWQAAGFNQLVFILLLVFVPLIGMVLYLRTARPALSRVI